MTINPQSTDHLRYPVGEFDYAADISEADHARLIDEIAMAPMNLRDAIAGLTPAQLLTPYRPGGWTVEQVVHHLPDSHMNAYCRTKLALTEEQPTIKPYHEAKWAQLADSLKTPVGVSLDLLEALHHRWVTLWRALTPSDFHRGYMHPELGHVVRLEQALAAYAWHGRHHAAHITELRKREGW